MKQAIVLISLFLIAVNWPNLKLLLAGEIDYDPVQSGAVTLYATKWCSYCAKTRAFLNKHDIPYVEIDVEQSTATMRQMTALGAFGVPVIVVGDTVIKGYQPSVLADALDSKNKD
ncbi:MAG: glutaredoxin family protein [Gammaproteobacteria bacterium]|nr:glutaredoxin family protein [Gammaproteobacteria bacterium]MDH3769231.1 glutaredoxin family protein [Gammaproteobacteria bacterium]